MQLSHLCLTRGFYHKLRDCILQLRFEVKKYVSYFGDTVTSGDAIWNSVKGHNQPRVNELPLGGKLHASARKFDVSL